MAELVSQSTSIQSAYSLYREDNLYVNRRYQRKLVWTLEEKRKLIDSILNKYPIPAILIAEKDDKKGAYEIIDGLQRLHAIVSFIETSYDTLDNKLFNLEHFPTAKSYCDIGRFNNNSGEQYLSQKEVTTILDYSLAMSVMRNATETEINDVFGRINTYGHRLSDQERRQAGVQNEFSTMVRELSSSLRGDVSSDVLQLYLMPSISIDLPKEKHGYEVQADEVFWVNQGILRSTDLRDSIDEQCIADIAACIVGGQPIERSKDALDDIYDKRSSESERISSALEVYGSSPFSDEFKFCVDEIINVCNHGKSEKLRDILFARKTTNAFPSVFAVIAIAFHELLIKESKKISNYATAKTALENLSNRIDTSRKATAPDERRRNIDTIKGLIGPSFITANQKAIIYGNHTTIDVESVIRRSEIELGNYELKQGLLRISENCDIDKDMIDKIINTICAIANNGPDSAGKVLIGVADKEADANRIKDLYSIEPKKIGGRYVVGINREAKKLNITTEKYISLWKDGIRKSLLSPHLRDSVLSNIDFNNFYGLGVIVITVPSQTELSFVGDKVYWRSLDSTLLAEDMKKAVELAKRF